MPQRQEDLTQNVWAVKTSQSPQVVAQSPVTLMPAYTFSDQMLSTWMFLMLMH